jgi:oligoendopeptidase F
MSDTTTDTTTTDGTKSTTSGAGDDAKVQFSDEQQKAVNALLANQKRDIRAQFADYDDMKTKASEFDKIAEANKSEVEKANDKAAKATAELATVPAKVATALRDHLIELHSIDEDKAELFLTATEPELLLRQVKALLGEADDRKKKSNVVTREAATSTTTADDSGRRSFLRQLTDRG